MQHIIPNVTAKYPRLNATYKFDSVEQRSVKCDPLDDGAAYEMQFVMDTDTAKTLHGLCLEAWKNAAAMDTRKKVAGETKPAAIQESRMMATVVGKAKLKGAYGTDKVDPPLQVDAKRNRLPADFMLTTGSRVNLSVTIVPYNTGAVNGVSLRLRAVQVLELAEGMTASDPFSAVDGYVVNETPAASRASVQNDPFASVSPAPSVAVDLGDDIPF
jgi:hypothetical protein